MWRWCSSSSRKSPPILALKWLLSGAGIPLLGLSGSGMIKYFPYVGRGDQRWVGSVQNLWVTGGEEPAGCALPGIGAGIDSGALSMRSNNRSYALRQLVVHGIVLALAVLAVAPRRIRDIAGVPILGGLLIPAITIAGGRGITGANFVVAGT